jgi:hypothetical protein
MNWKRIAFLVACYGIGIALDAERAVALCIDFFETLGSGADTSYGLLSALALMAGWTVLLAWAALKPVERRGVLLLTAIPVVALIWAGTLVSLPLYEPTFMTSLALYGGPFLMALYLAAYLLAGKWAKEQKTSLGESRDVNRPNK